MPRTVNLLAAMGTVAGLLAVVLGWASFVMWLFPHSITAQLVTVFGAPALVAILVVIIIDWRACR